MTIDPVNLATGIQNIQPIDYDWVEKLFNEYIPPGATGTTEGLLDGLQKFFETYLNDPRNIYSGLNVAGGSGDVYKVRYDATDLEGYLGGKLTAGTGITLSVSTGSNKVISIEMNIEEVDGEPADVSLLFDPSTMKKLQASESIGITETDGVLKFEVISGDAIIWKGEWKQQQYLKNEQVRDGAWTRIANKTTTDRAGVVPEGEEFNVYQGFDLINSQVSAKQVIAGSRYSLPETGYIKGYRINTVAGNEYTVFSVKDPLGDSIQNEILKFTASSNGWTDFSIDPIIVGSGFVFDLIVIIDEPDNTPVIETADFNYSTPTNLTIPTNGQITQADKNRDLLLVSKTDANSNDVSGDLAGLTVGDIIDDGEIRWSIQSTTDETNHVTFGVSPQAQSTDGLKTFSFETTVATPISYANEANYWSTNPNVQGLFIVDGSYDDITPDQTAYGVDIIVQGAFVSPDWDTVAFSGAGASGGGNLPPINEGDAGKKMVVNQAETGYELVASSTTAGFKDRDDVVLSFDNGTRTLTLTPKAPATDFTLINSLGEEFIKTTDSIQIGNTDTLHGIYYDINGDLVDRETNTPSEIKTDMETYEAIVSYIDWDVTDQVYNLVTDVRKGRKMGRGAWAKNAYDLQIYVLGDGIGLGDDPSQGGTVTPPSGDDTSAQFSIASGVVSWTDADYNVDAKAVGDNYNIFYKFGTHLHSQLKINFAVLTDNDVITPDSGTGRIVYSDDGTLETVGNNDYVFYGIAYTNDISQDKRLVSYMGTTSYENLGDAEVDVVNEAARIENLFAIRQESRIKHMILLKTSNTYSNSVKSIIIEVFTIQDLVGAALGGQTGDISINNTIIVGKGGAVDYNTIQGAINAAVDTDVILFYPGVYTEDLTIISKTPSIQGVDREKCIINGKINYSNPGGTDTIEISDCQQTYTTTTDNDISFQAESDAQVATTNFISTTFYSGDIGVTDCKIGGAATLTAIQTSFRCIKTGGDDAGSKEIKCLDAPNITGDLSLANDVSFIHITPTANDKLYGAVFGGTAPSHAANFLFGVQTSNPAYTGEMNGLRYTSNTTVKTGGDVTVRVDDAGSGTLYAVRVEATSGDYVLNNINGYYAGSGSAYAAYVNTGATLQTGALNLDGVTSLSTGGGTINAYGLINGVFRCETNINMEQNSINQIKNLLGDGTGTITGFAGATLTGTLDLTDNRIDNASDVDCSSLSSTGGISGGGLDISGGLSNIRAGADFHNSDIIEVKDLTGDGTGDISGFVDATFGGLLTVSKETTTQQALLQNIASVGETSLDLGTSTSGATLSRIASDRTNRAVTGDSDIVFYTYSNSILTEAMRLKDTGVQNNAITPTSPAGLVAGDRYTQTAAQLGGTGTTKVVCVV